MKKIIGAFIALYSAFAFSATTVPVQLLNPTGSTSGQVITSTGASSAPAWQTVTLSGVTGTLAVGNGGTGATTLTAHGVLLGQGTGAVTAVAPGAVGTLLTSTGTTTDPTYQALSSSSISGVTNGGNAAAGIVGEYATGSALATSASSGVAMNGAVLSNLAAGDWDVTGFCQTGPAGSTTTNSVVAGISSTSASFESVAAGITNDQALTGLSIAAGSPVSLVAPVTRKSLSATANVYLVCQAGFATSTMTINGWIRARRVR